MRRYLTTLLAALAAALLLFGLAATAQAAGSKGKEQVCSGTHLFPSTTTASLTYTAPEGYLVSAWCVKAGSVKQGNGPEYHSVEPPAASIVISHSSGKDVSHYSVTLVAKDPTTPTDPDPYPDPDPDPIDPVTPTEPKGTPTHPVPCARVPAGKPCGPPPPTQVSPDPIPPVELKIDHAYSCDTHTRITSEKRDGVWVEVDREVTPLSTSTCGNGRTFKQAVKEEGM